MDHQTVAHPKEGLRTKIALLWMNLSSEPLTAIYSFLPFLVRKEFQASTYEIALFTTLTPIASVFSFYWGFWLSKWKHHLHLSLSLAWICARVPFLFFPWIHDFWSMFLGSLIYQFFSRASTPALMEILKRTLPQKNRDTSFALYYLLSVLEGIGIGIILTQALHLSHNNWKILFLICSLISLSSVLWQLRIRLPQEKTLAEVGPSKATFLEPVKSSFSLLKNRKDFALFQWSFMIGGFALMLIAPARAIFIADSLPISIGDMTLAKCVFVGIGMATSSMVWKKNLENLGPLRITPWILLGFGLFPLILLLSGSNIAWFYLAHLVYGFAQGGSHLVWHLSGPIFAGKNESSIPFTTVSVLMAGMRGAIAPLLGGVLCYHTSSAIVLGLGGALALYGAYLTPKLIRSKEL